MTLCFFLRTTAAFGFLFIIVTRCLALDTIRGDLGEEFYMICKCPTGYYEAEKFSVSMDKPPNCGAPKRQLIVCSSGRRWKVDGVRCVRCHPNCFDCTGPTDDTCLHCAPGLYNLTVTRNEPPADLTSIYEEVTFHQYSPQEEESPLTPEDDTSSTTVASSSTERRKPREAESSSSTEDTTKSHSTTDEELEEELPLEKLFTEEELLVTNTEKPSTNGDTATDFLSPKKLDKRFVSFGFRDMFTDDSGSSSGLHDDHWVPNSRLSLSFNFNGQHQLSPTTSPPPTSPNVFQLPAGILVPIRPNGRQDGGWEPIPPISNPLPPGYLLNPGIVGPPVGDPAVNPILIKPPPHNSDPSAGAVLPKKPVVVSISSSAVMSDRFGGALHPTQITETTTLSAVQRRRTTATSRTTTQSTTTESLSSTENQPVLPQVIHRCVIQCPNNTYSRGSSCEPCDPICASCNGPSKANCTTCSSSAVKNPESAGCLSACPDNYYPQSGTCEQCHPECQGGCSGPGPQNCSGCKHEWPAHSATLSSGCYVPLTEAPPSPLEVILPVSFVMVFIVVGTLILVYFRWGSLISKWCTASLHKLRNNEKSKKVSDKSLPKQITPKQVLKNVYTPAPPGGQEKIHDRPHSLRDSDIEEDGYELPVASVSFPVESQPSTSGLSSTKNIVRPRKNEPLPPTPVADQSRYNVPKPLDASILHRDAANHPSSDEDDDYDDVLPPSPRVKSFSEPPLPIDSRFVVNRPNSPATYNNSEGLYVNC